MNQNVHLDVSTVLWLLIAAFVAMMIARRLKLPYTIALVVIGLIVGSTHLLKVIHLSYDLVFGVFLPPLLFDAAIRLPVDLLKRNWKPVALLAVPGVIVSTLIIGYAIHSWVGIALSSALVFGALISATDPVSVIARFRRLRIDRRLMILVEGESLFNDGTAAVLYSSLIAAAVGGIAVNPAIVTGDFARSIAIGVLIGGGLGWGISLVMSHINDHLVEITLTTIAAYGASLLAGLLGASGVISVISSGIVLGYYRGEASMSATTRAAVYSFWEYIAFAVNSILFLLIGIDVTVTRMAHDLTAMGIAIGSVLLARAVVVYLSGLLLSHSDSRIPLKWQHVLNIGGLRGALAIALALGLPSGFGPRDTIVAMTYGVVLWTLLPQGLSLSWMIRKLGLAGRTDIRDDHDRIATKLLAQRASLAEVEKMRGEGIVPPRLCSELTEKIENQISDLENQLDRLQDEHPEISEEQWHDARLRILAAQQNAIRQATEQGIASYEIGQEITAEAFEEYGEEREE